jgi:hypothetical protein
MVPGPLRGSADEGEEEETSRSENKTRLTAWREPGSLQRQRGLSGVVSTAMQALRRLTATTSSCDLTLMVKERALRRRTT